jgi:plasmid stabilization system protein ParE
MVIFANEAKADLNEIGDYIARDDPDRAVSFIDEVIDCCESLEFGRAPFRAPRDSQADFLAAI